jgi:selenocysteine lyase/cysteine desulfurase
LQADYASQEAVLVQVAADLRATNAEMQRSIDAMRAVLAETRAAGEEEVVRRNRNATEAEEAVAAATAQQRFYLAATQVLSDDGANVAASPVAPELRRLSERLQTMRSISEDLAG